MKKIIRLTESDLHRIVKESVNRILKEDVLGNDWHENEEDAVMNNYEPFESQEDLPFDGMQDDHDWSGVGEEEFDPTFYDDPDQYRDDVINGNDSPSDNDLYNGRW